MGFFGTQVENSRPAVHHSGDECGLWSSNWYYHWSYARFVRQVSNRQLTEEEFKYFHDKYIVSPEGSHEYFLRTIFAVFDVNGDGVLEMREVDHFLDLFLRNSGRRLSG